MIVKKCVDSFTYLSLLLCSVMLVAMCFFTSQARAIDTSCSTGDDIFSAAITLPTDTYDVYVKLGRVGQGATVQVSTSGTNAGCIAVGQAAVSGDAWTKIGQTTLSRLDAEVQFNLASGEIDQGYEYDRPIVMLVSQTNPACVPTTDCFISIGEEQAALQPTTTESDTGTLRILRIQNSTTRVIKEVRYYVDGEYMYKTKQLEKFSQQSIPYYGRTLSRVIEFENGQTAIITQPVPVDSSDGLGSMLSRSIRKYQPLLVWAIIIVGLVIIYHIIRHIITAIESRRYWLHAHGFIKDAPSKPLTQSRLSYLYKMEVVRKIIRGLGTLGLLAVISVGIILVLDSFVVRLSTVNGVSMLTSLNNGQKVLIDKTGVTLSRINQSDFTPNRGQVVAAYLVSRFNSQDEVSDENIMIKRVIGLPGERVVISGNEVTIYNSEHPDGFDPALSANWSENVIKDIGTRKLDVTLSNDEVFVIGDNRPASIDSRVNGPLKLSNIIGVIH